MTYNLGRNNRFVIDANIIFNAILKQSGDTNKLLFSPNISFVIPDFVFVEIEKYEKLFSNKGILYKPYLDNFLQRDVKIYESEQFKNDILLTQEKMINIDPKDSVYVFFAQKLGIPLWTNDKILIEKVNWIEIIDTETMIKNFI